MNTNSTEDHGEVVRAPRVHRIWAWIFPVIAASAAVWLFWSNWSARGPEIEIQFDEAPGIQVGKTVLIFRGVTSGKVTGVVLDPALDGVIVKVRLTASAAHLANSGTDFWIDQPVISITETTGLDAIIQGNSIQARMGDTGTPSTRFQGLAQAPLTPLDSPALVVNLNASEIPFIGRGTPVFHRGVPVGFVAEKHFDDADRPTLRVIIDAGHAGRVRTSSRFWIIPAAALNLSARGASLDIAGLAALIQGGIAFDHFDTDGEPAADHANYPLAANEAVARADGPAMTIAFRDGAGIIPGETRVTCLGQPIGLVEDLTLDPSGGPSITATVRLESAYQSLATDGAEFTLVRPAISLNGVSGLETIVSGPRIDLRPGTGKPATNFVGRITGDRDAAGISLTLTASGLDALSEGAPVFYRGISAGRVTAKRLNSENSAELDVLIAPEFASAVRENSRFWRVPATSVSAGPGVLDVEIQGLLALVQGGIAFDVFEQPAGIAGTGSRFSLFESETTARAVSPEIQITFGDGRGLLAGKSQLRYLGIPIGIVDTVRPANGKVIVHARFNAGFEAFRRQGATFALVQPKISLKELSGIETIISGVYIECLPGTGSLMTAFTGLAESQPEILERRGFDIRITTPKTTIRPGAPILYRDLAVGEVVGKELSENSDHIVLTARIDDEYRHLVRKNSVFWDSGQVMASLGPLKLRINSATLVAPDGQIGFANPEKPGDPAEVGQTFELAGKPPR